MFSDMAIEIKIKFAQIASTKKAPKGAFFLLPINYRAMMLIALGPFWP